MIPRRSGPTSSRYGTRMARRVVACTAALILTACATPAAYQPARAEDLDEIGYLDHQLAPDQYAVAFLANCHTSRRRAFDFAMLRAAELGVHNGFLYFSILRRKEDSTIIETGSTTYAFPMGSSWVAASSTHRAVCPIFAFVVQYFRDRPNRGLDLIKCGDTAKALSSRYGVDLAY